MSRRAPPKRYLCLCSECSKVTHIDDTGQSIPGALVSLTTRNEHRRNDSEAAVEEMPGISADTGPQIPEPQPTTDNTQTTLPANAFQEGTNLHQLLENSLTYQ
jgi:hypothetical protein